MNMTDKKMKIEFRKVCELAAYGKNARTHSDAQVAQIAASIKEFGFTNPVLIDEEGGIIAGHGRVMAARKLAMQEVPCIKLEHLTDTQKRAYVIADNKLALNAGWDEELLSLELNELNEDGFELDKLGFEAEDLSRLLYGVNFEPGTEDDQGKLDELAPQIVICPHCGESFNAKDQK